MLELRNLHAYYGKSHVLHGVSLSCGEREIVSLLGRNGAGRSTTLKAIMGAVPPHGTVTFNGRSLVGLAPHAIVHLGLAYVPEDRQIFPSLTVQQNLNLGVKRRRANPRWDLRRTYEMFPRLAERADTPAGVLSGGEQQMLTICRSLMGDPDVVMIDEPTEGLSPQMVERVGELLSSIAALGISILLVEQRLTIALRISHRVYVMGHGRIVYEGTPEELLAADAVRRDWLEV